MLLCEHEIKARKILEMARVDSPGLCSRVLAAYASGLDKLGYILHCHEPLSPIQEKFFYELVARRAAGEPLAYILGKKEFFGLEFIVSPATLIPRPETELLVELALNLLPESPITFADLGCGSGCIGLALLAQRPAWHGVLIDNSGEALKIAQKNNQLSGCQAALLKGDLFNLPLGAQSLNLILGNPPYIGRHDVGHVMNEVLAYEPHSALFSGNAGFAHLNAVIIGAQSCLKKGGWLIVEHGAQQAEEVSRLLEQAQFAKIQLHKDLAGLYRCATAQKE